MAKAAFALSEEFSLPVMLRSVTRLSHGKSDVILGERSARPDRGRFEKNSARFVMVPAHARVQHRRVNELQDELTREMDASPYNLLTMESGAKTGIIAAGLCYEYAAEYADTAPEPCALLKIGTYPLPVDKISRLLAAVENVLVLEEIDPVVEEQLYRWAKEVNPAVRICGKLNGHVPKEGELSVEAVAAAMDVIHGRPARKSRSLPVLPGRPPTLCPGCPHRASFNLLKRVFDPDTVYPGDIGCYTLGLAQGMIDTCVCMGSGISLGAGISQVEPGRTVVPIIGDSTFFHAGIPALLNACYNQANIVLVILDNRTTAMTGHQPHAGTGLTASGAITLDVDLQKLALACGARTAAVLNPLKVQESLEALKKIKEDYGVRVVIFREPCILLKT